MIESKITSLDLSKQLKEAGYIQGGLWFWYEHPESDSIFVERIGYLSKDGLSSHICVAPTVAELGATLPGEITHDVECVNGKILKNVICDLMIMKSKDIYIVEYMGAKGFEDKVFANAMAKMKLYLLEKENKQ